MEFNDEIEKELKLYFEKMLNIEFRIRLGGNKKIHMSYERD